MHWTAEQHNQWYGKNFNDGMNRWVVETLKPKTVLEFGCGVGWYCEFFSKNGVETVHGIYTSMQDHIKKQIKLHLETSPNIYGIEQPTDITTPMFGYANPNDISSVLGVIGTDHGHAHNNNNKYVIT